MLFVKSSTFGRLAELPPGSSYIPPLERIQYAPIVTRSFQLARDVVTARVSATFLYLKRAKIAVEPLIKHHVVNKPRRFLFHCHCVYSMLYDFVGWSEHHDTFRNQTW